MERGVFLERAVVDTLRQQLAAERELYEPRGAPGNTDWRRASADEPFDWHTTLPLSSAKRFFFPTRERLLRWNGGGAQETPPAPPGFVLFGLRGCDLVAIAHQDRFFAADPWYRRRRESALRVGVNCLTACAGGFCRDVAAGPFATGGFDLALTMLPAGRVVVEFGSAAGRAACTEAHVEWLPFDAEASTAFDAAAAAAAASFRERPFVALAVARLNAHTRDASVADAEWQALGPSCFMCTGCTNLCPTCTCFTIVDELCEGGGERVRYWDSCLLEGFQREASGHHPASRVGDRVRRFWSHKFSQDFSGYVRPACVGCGRCDIACPGSIGALHVLATLGAQP